METTNRLPRISFALRPLAILLAVFAFFLTACGGGAGGDGSSTTTTASSTPTPSSYTLQVNKTGSGTVTSSPAGINCGSACSASYASGTSVTLTAAAGSGYTFSGWSGSGVSCAGTGSCTVSMTAARTVTATFSQTAASSYTLSVAVTGTGSVTSSPAGINCGSACSASYASGTSVTLTAAAGSGYTFSGWSGSGVACSGTTCTVAMSVSRIVTASFAPTSTTATTIRLIPATTSPGTNELVSLAIPFPPDTLTDASRLRILDVNGNEVPAYVVPKVYWYFKTNAAAIRSVLVQFRMNFPSSAEQRVTFDYSALRQQDLAAPNYAEGLMIGKSGTEIPRILPALTAEWLTSSLVAGPQITKTQNTAYPDYETWFETFYAQAKNYDYSTDYTVWLFDRVTAIYKQYIRTGNPDYLREAYNSATFYRSRINTSGSCIGSFNLGGKNCDAKYNYTESLALHYMLTGDDRFVQTIRDVAEGWNNGFDPDYTVGNGFWTERHAGFGWMAAIHAYEALGTQSYRDRMTYYANTLFAHVTAPPDGQGTDGCWRHDSYDHDAAEFNSNYAGCSAWMSTIIMDAMWKYWNLTGDARVGPAVRNFVAFMENYAWMSSTNTYYFPSSRVPASTYANAEDEWTDSHNLEMIFTYSLAYAFDTNSTNRLTYTSRITNARSIFTYGAVSTKRAFNWAFRGTSPFVHLMRQ